jgi:phosphatidylinositol alpha-1,6-mannosyltransferase
VTDLAQATGAPRTLLLAYDFPPMGGGIAGALGALARHAVPGRLIVSTGRQPGDAEADALSGARVDRVAVPSDQLRTLSGLARWAWRARQLAREQGTDFVWAGNLKPAGHVAHWLQRRDAIPYGLIVYGLDLNRLKVQCNRSGMKRRLARGILQGAAGTVAISDWVAGQYRELARGLGLPEAADRIATIPLGVDGGRFHPDAPVAREHARGGGPARRLLTVARLVPHKGIDTALRLVAALLAEGQDVEYLVAGSGPAHEGLVRLATDLGIAHRVRWLGAVPDRDLPGLYASTDLYLGLSREEGSEVEGFGLALLEAQATGVPVLAGRGGGTADAVADGITGVLVPTGDSAAVAAAARQLLADPARAAAMGAAGRRRALEAFDWTRVARAFDAAAERFRVATAGAGAGRAGR